jgi:FAD:protein FMN transferase
VTRSGSFQAARAGVLLAVVWVCGCEQPVRTEARAPLVVTRLGLGVRFQIALIGDDDARLEAIAHECFAEVDRLESILNNWDPQSAVSRWNAAPGMDWAPVPAELAEVVFAAQRMTVRTNGAYDITIGPALEVFGFDRAAPAPPAPDQIAAALARIGSEALEVDVATSRLRRTKPGVVLDVSSLAKGYVTDRIATLLRERGIENAFIAAGSSSVSALGEGSTGDGWPFEVGDGIVWRLRDVSVATSGRFGREVTIGEERIGHIFDPRTARPVDRTIDFVSVRGPSGLEADMMSTALIVLGAADAARWFETDPELEGTGALLRDATTSRVTTLGRVDDQ